jgi:hypothetical protein
MVTCMRDAQTTASRFFARDPSEPFVMPTQRHKTDAMCRWKERAFEALFQAFYDVVIRFRIGHGLFECDGCFISDMDVNREIVPLLPERPKILIDGDFTGLSAITSLAMLKPAHVDIVARQDDAGNEVLADNVNGFFRAMDSYCERKRKRNVYRNEIVGRESSSFSEYNSDFTKKALMRDYAVSLHNRFPWEFIKGLRSNHFDLLIYIPVWNQHVQEIELEIEAEMAHDTAEHNFKRPLDLDLENDLAFREHEASHFATFRTLDAEVIKPMELVGATVDVIVLRVRGLVTPETWEQLKADGSLVAKTHAIILQMEEWPNERDSRLVVNPDTGECDKLPDASDRPSKTHIREKKDVNGGKSGQIFAVVLQRRDNGGGNARCRYIPYKRDWWYGPYMNARDADKQGMYVKKTSHEVPCQRISPEPSTLDVVMERQFKGDASQYTMIHARDRKIEVQIEDLTFLSYELLRYEQALDSGEPITPDEHYRIMQEIAQGEYSYKIIEVLASQSNRGDSSALKVYGQNLIDTKVSLFHSTHCIMRRIMHRNGWILPTVAKGSSHYEDVPRENPAHYRNHRRQFIRPRVLGGPLLYPVKSHTASILSQSIDFSKPIMLGGKDCLEDAAFMDSDDLDSMLDDEENEEEGRASDEEGETPEEKEKKIDQSKKEQKELLGNTGGGRKAPVRLRPITGDDRMDDYGPDGGAAPTAPKVPGEGKLRTADLTPQDREDGWEAQPGNRVASSGSLARTIADARRAQSRADHRALDEYNADLDRRIAEKLKVIGEGNDEPVLTLPDNAEGNWANRIEEEEQTDIFPPTRVDEDSEEDIENDNKNASAPARRKTKGERKAEARNKKLLKEAESDNLPAANMKKSRRQKKQQNAEPGTNSNLTAAQKMHDQQMLLYERTLEKEKEQHDSRLLHLQEETLRKQALLQQLEQLRQHYPGPIHTNSGDPYYIPSDPTTRPTVRPAMRPLHHRGFPSPGPMFGSSRRYTSTQNPPRQIHVRPSPHIHVHPSTYPGPIHTNSGDPYYIPAADRRGAADVDFWMLDDGEMDFRTAPPPRQAIYPSTYPGPIHTNSAADRRGATNVDFWMLDDGDMDFRTAPPPRQQIHHHAHRTRR